VLARPQAQRREVPLPCSRRQLGDDKRLRQRTPGDAEHAIASGDRSAGEVSDWCQETLHEVFANGEVTAVITGYVAKLAVAAGQASELS
jgi:hypothetical protein